MLASAGAWVPQTPWVAPGTPAAQESDAADGRRTSGAFAKNMGRNAADLYDSDNAAPFLIGAGATGFATLFDERCKHYFGVERRARRVGDFADQLGKPYVIGPVAGALYGIGRLSHDHERFREGSYDLAQATIVSLAYTAAIKYTVRRMRPDGSNRLSFPSGHTSNAFAWATIGNHYYGPGVGVPAYLLAGFIGVGRMEKRAHHLSDVVGGATLGYLVARTVIRKDDEPTAGATTSAGVRRTPRPKMLVRASFRF